MKHLRNFATFLLMVASMMTLAQGQAGAPGIKLTVPFSFVIGRSAFSAGDYLIYSVKDKVWVQRRAAGISQCCFLSRSTGKSLSKMAKSFSTVIRRNAFCPRSGLLGRIPGAHCPDRSAMFTWRVRALASNSPCWVGSHGAKSGSVPGAESYPPRLSGQAPQVISEARR